MTRFAFGHAGHPDARMAFAMAGAQLDEQRPPGATLGWLYLTDRLAGEAETLLAAACERWPGTEWVGAVGVGVCANGVEYFDEPALALMLCDLPREQFHVFSGARPLPREFEVQTAQVHADPSTPELAELIADMSGRTRSGYVFGGLAGARTRMLHIADEVLSGGLSGVAFGPGLRLLSRVTQGCQPVGPAHRVDEAERNVATVLDGKPALDVLLQDLGLAGIEPKRALPQLRATLVGLSDPDGTDALSPLRAGAFGADVRVRHLIGLDPGRRGIAVAEMLEPGMQLAFCNRDVEAARRDLTRICAEIRDEIEGEDEASGSPMEGALYVSCVGRGGPHFGAPSAELAIVRRALGDVPLVGFFAGGEIGHRHLYGYTGVLTVFAGSS